MKGTDGRGTFDWLLLGQRPAARWNDSGRPELEWLVLWIAVLGDSGGGCLLRHRENPPQDGTEGTRRPANGSQNVRELHSQGELSDEEFRTIKTNLATQLQDELNDNGEKG